MTTPTGNTAVQNPQTADSSSPALQEDDFLSKNDLLPIGRDAARRSQKRHLGDIEELTRENKWEDVISLYHPVSEKLPEVAAHNLDTAVREKIAFALGQLSRFDEAIAELQICVRHNPNSFRVHNSLSYTAYNSLYAAKNREIMLNGKARTQRLELAHRHFRDARALRPDTITINYREGMLYRKLENKPDKALPCFKQAVENWNRLEEADRQARHYERKNYIKAIYQLASLLLEQGQAEKALRLIKTCLVEDEKSGHLTLVFKYFALGKIQFHLNDFEAARDALLFAIQSRSNQDIDFVCELLGRTYLALENPAKALEIIARVPVPKRRPYVRWTEADVLCALEKYDAARNVLLHAQQRDNRSRHKSLIRLVKIEYLLGNVAQTEQHAQNAVNFYEEKWGNLYAEGVFWQAVCALKAGNTVRAAELTRELEAHHPDYPDLGKLKSKLQV